MVFGWGKKKDIPRDIPQVIHKDITLSEISSIVESIAATQSAQLIQHTKKLHPLITQHIDALLEIATQIEKDALDTEQIDNNIATIVKRGKKQVLAAIHKESERNFPEINSVDDVKTFIAQSSQALTRIGDVLGKQTRVIHIFAKKYAGKLKDILARYTEDNAQAKRILDGYRRFEQNYDASLSLLQKINTENQTITSNKKRISDITLNISTIKSEINSTQDSISQFKSSDTYKKYLDIKSQLDTLNSQKSQIEHDINNQTILISRPISKYEYGSSLEKEQKVIIEKFLHSPFDVFLSENKSTLVTILDNVKKAISLEHISVKEPQKTIEYINDIAIQLDVFIKKIELFLQQQRDLKEQLRNLDLASLQNYEKRHLKLQDDLNFSQARLIELTKEVETLQSHQSEYITNLQDILHRINGAVKYTIIKDNSNNNI